ncbi:MAG: hypothetical protein NUV65_03520 [Candidatus Roizmanbacteria bacterium]|nr:hypothetical protein [Candidatus Roizmanbacteria bacterium]
MDVGGTMSTEIKHLVTVCLPFLKVKIYGEWYTLTNAVAQEVEELRKQPLVWIYFKQNRCADCNLAHECVNVRDS